MATVTMQPRVLRAVDLPHAAGAEQRLEHVRTELRAGRQGHGMADYGTGMTVFNCFRYVTVRASWEGCLVARYSFNEARYASERGICFSDCGCSSSMK